MYENPEVSVNSAKALMEHNKKRENETKEQESFKGKAIQLALEQVTSAKVSADESAAQTNLLKEANRHALELNEIVWRADERAKTAEIRAVSAEKAAAFARRSAIMANIIAVIAIAISIKNEIWELVLHVTSLFH